MTRAVFARLLDQPGVDPHHQTGVETMTKQHETARYCAAVALAHAGQRDNPRPLQWVDLTRETRGDETATSLAAGGKTPRGCFKVVGALPHGATIQPRNRAAALLWLEVIGEWLEDNPDGFPVLAVDAWRDPVGGWVHNSTFATGETMPRALHENGSPRAVLSWFREVGLLDPTRSPGRVAVETDGADGLEIVARGTREPLYWVPWREDETETGGEG